MGKRELFARSLDAHLSGPLRAVVVELGSGSRPFYRPDHTYICVDSRRSDSPNLLIASAENLPLRSSIADVVVGFQVLCSVRDVASTITEIRRVTKPGGVYLGVEHVRNPNPLLRVVQRFRTHFRGTRGRCRLGLDVPTLLLEAGFDVHVQRFPRAFSPYVQFTADPCERAHEPT